MKRLFCVALGMALTTTAHAATIVGLFNTGTNGSSLALAGGNGVVDTHYIIQSSTSAGFAGSQAVTYFNGSYAADDANSRWVSLSATGSPGVNTTRYRTTFSLTGFIASTASITGKWGADNVGTIYLNGVNTGITTNQFSTLTAFTLSSGFVAGLNTLDFEVVDQGDPTALRVDDMVGTATAVSGAVPEPASWAMMIAGFGIVGAAARRRRVLAIA